MIESTLHEIQAALPHFPNLNHATFKIMQKTSRTETWFNEPAICRHLTVTSLNLTLSKDTILSELAQNIALPNLNSLEFCFELGKNVGAQLKAMAGIIKGAAMETFILRSAWLSTSILQMLSIRWVIPFIILWFTRHHQFTTLSPKPSSLP